jgi:hypothetical protein
MRSDLATFAQYTPPRRAPRSGPLSPSRARPTRLTHSPPEDVLELCITREWQKVRREFMKLQLAPPQRHYAATEKSSAIERPPS